MNEASDSKFITRKWKVVNYQSNSHFDVENEIIYNTEVLKSIFCHYSNVYFLVRGNVTATAAPATQVSFKNSASFTMCITIDDAGDLDLVLPMCGVIECSSNCSETIGLLWLFKRSRNWF